MLKVAGLFSQILGEISRIDFQKLVINHSAGRYAKGFRSWTQFVAMLFCHLACADLLREICHGLSCCNGKVVHLGVNRAPNKFNPWPCQWALPCGALRRSVLDPSEPVQGFPKIRKS